MAQTLLPTLDDKSDWAETVDQMKALYGLHDITCTMLKDSGISCLEEFRYFWASKEAIQLWVAAGPWPAVVPPEVSPKALQTAKLTRAWANYNTRANAREASAGPGTTAQALELDDVLEDNVLANVHRTFWARYKTRYPPVVMPGDQLISRVWREMVRRQLSCYNVWGVKNMMHQVHSTRKAKAVGIGIFTMEEEEQANPARTVEKYLQLLQTYLIALAIAGAARVRHAPADAEHRGSNSCNYVEVPWDVVSRYHYRCLHQSSMIPHEKRLAWLERTDTDERALWCEQFREGPEDLTLGMVIAQNHDLRSPYWQIPLVVRSGAPVQEKRWDDTRPNKRPKGKGKGKSERRGGAGKPDKRPLKVPGSKAIPGTKADHLANGVKLCRAFNSKEGCSGSAKGKGKGCARGQHKCSKVTKRGRVCGMNSHGAHECRN